ncbi:hypothetical protein CLAFUW4_14639 [Fulvia fulva]|uniref:Pyrrolopyrazine biosynthesis cluster protein F n=1 Tax=Passalora fulva TaxID=5499 RepID=A0A9Q8PM69_PASFU|nr:Pyrrolopyrazine biosynthesis cluster protein F [Fulvia fulva]UJO24992.1 Pyrrolopyrazine biosynthesis cluster protein F [Fulvia fulva]WPV22899.1 hypothetical protein CLAFUW4_14639 [Fulvia fulva]
MTIRHPAFVVPAAYDALSNSEKSGNISNYLIPTNYSWQTQLYNFYVANGITPVVAEAEDYMSSPEFVRHLASEAGLDASTCLFEWDAMSEDDQAAQHPMYVKLQQTLINSTGLVPGKVKGAPVLEDEERKWREKFGVEGAVSIKEMVEWAMPDYEYLRDRKLRLP